MALFYNYSTLPFTYTWAGIPYTFKAGEVYEGVIIADNGGAPLELNDILARFFSKHLAEFVLNTPGINTNFRPGLNGESIPTDGFPMKYNTTSIDQLTERGITAPEIGVPMPKFVDELPISSTEGATIVVEAPEDEPVVVAKKRGRPAKVKEDVSPSPEAEFEGV